MTPDEAAAIDAAVADGHAAEPLPPLGPQQAAALRRVVTIHPALADTA